MRLDAVVLLTTLVFLATTAAGALADDLAVATSLQKNSKPKKIRRVGESSLSTDDAFKFLKLDDAGDKILSHSDFKVWTKFVTMVKKYPEGVVLEKLQTQYGEAKFAEMLQQATLVRRTKKTALKLQNAEFEQWYQNGMKSTGAVIDNICNL
ncbi:unnamed protein product [Phytophthora fragariaefolia]|uniref:Unnamed protein product n=1 Tax=Phytophthora fragariaefolia TaxID=1490495 RepID=A0A9W6XK20_9STRA|nr:unnamed protein product [Phytophthora fragariaefolia]